MNASPGRTIARAFAVLLLLSLCGRAALAGVHEPPRYGCSLSGQTHACQFVFRSDGSADRIAVNLTLWDPFDNPVTDCEISATLVAAGAPYFCSGCPNPQIDHTDGDGIVTLEFAKIGGYGDLEVRVTAHCPGSIAICDMPLAFTSPDLLGTCDPVNAVDIRSLGVWATGITPYEMYSDYNCDGTVNVIDLGYWASGLLKGCMVPNPNCPY